MATKPLVPSTDAVKQLALKAVTSGVTRVVATLVDPAGSAKRAIEDVRELPTKAAGLPLKVALEVVAAGEKVRALLPGSKAAVVAEKVTDKAREVGHAIDPDAIEIDSADDWDAAAPGAQAPKPDPTAYVPPVIHDKAVENPVEVAAAKAATPVKRAPVKTAAKAPAKKAAVKLAAAPGTVPSALTEAVKESVIAALDEPLAEVKPAAKPGKTVKPVDDAPVATVTPIHAGRDGHKETVLSDAVEAAIEAAPDGASLTSKELPIPGFDNLSLAQLRAKLSKLDIVAVTQLRDHERSHADRAPIVTMLENRITKLAASGSPS